MAVYLGNNKLTFDGISEIYVGSNKVYSATPPGPPIIDNPVNEYFCVYSAKSFTIRFEKIQTENGASANLNYNNLKLKYSTNKTNWTEVSATQGFNFNGGTIYYIYTSSAEVGTTGSSSSLSIQSASWGQAFNFVYNTSTGSSYYSYTSTVMSFSGSSTIYLMGNIRTLSPGDSITTPYNTLVGSKTKIDCVSNSSSSNYGYCVRCCGLGTSSIVGSTTIRARGISTIKGTSNSIIDINNLYIGSHDTSTDSISYPTFSYSTGTPYTPPYDPSEDYFYIENLTSSSNTLKISKQNNATSITIYRSTNKNTWTSMGSTSTSGITYSIPSRSKVYLKATSTSWGGSYNALHFITCTGNYAVGGNIMSLVYGDSFIGQTTTRNYMFASLFSSQTNLKNIDNLVLPGNSYNGYYQMFASCTGLTSIPSTLLPSTTLNNQCYRYMFQGCTGITSLPENLLPATTLATECYYGMFNGCSGITSIPSNFLPATTLADSCYRDMFQNNSGLTSVPNLPAITLANYCYSSIFSGCRNITKAPELPATTLTDHCYQSMFNGCNKLNEITCYANNISASGCTSGWVNGVASSGTFHKKGTAAWTTGTNGIPSGWSVVNT